MSEERSQEFCTVEEAIEELRAGRLIIVVDDKDRENEGDFVMAAEFCTPEAVTVMARKGGGLICVAATEERLAELDLKMMVENNTSKLGTQFTVTVDARRGTSTGISASDRAHTIRVLADPATQPDDLCIPGHIFPLRAQPGGVLVRAGHTEAVVDLMSLAGLRPCGVLCEIMSESGHEMARVPELLEIASKHNLKVLTVADLIKHRRHHEKLIHRVASAQLPTKWGQFVAHAYEAAIDSNPYVALVMGNITEGEPPLVRIHSGCLTGDALGSLRCDCGDQLDLAMQKIASEGRGVLLYIQQEGRGIGLVNKLKAYVLQDHGADTVEANEMLGFPPDIRDYSLGAQVLVDLGLKRLRLMTNNPSKYAALEGYELEIVERVPLVAGRRPESMRYLNTKRTKMGHIFESGETPAPRENGCAHQPEPLAETKQQES
ncbi:MAG: bifunctional 3,4-dihydroxy-2-butanone-4-phosphate synthase/GTP cyclohydrolase II [Armatimonadetes bacterium]|nr:bifunctional 3,4-dihydroxy-2-butanone-4-phosphate synthase/GTP cyclohydrolase II [Armatimonadota bacterium]